MGDVEYATPEIKEPAMPHTPTQQKVRDAISPERRQTVEQIAEATGLPASAVTKALKVLHTVDHCVVLIPASKEGQPDRWRAATLSERHLDDPPSDGARFFPLIEQASSRKAPEPLRALVAEQLAAAEAPLSAYQIGKALGRSAGAVQNALDKLVQAGEAVQTSTKPRAYAAKN